MFATDGDNFYQSNFYKKKIEMYMKIFSSETMALLANVFENLFFWHFWTFGDGQIRNPDGKKLMFHILMPTAISRWIHQFSSDHWS